MVYNIYKNIIQNIYWFNIYFSKGLKDSKKNTGTEDIIIGRF